MKLFIKEHILLICMQCVQWGFMGLLLILSGFNDYKIMLYGLIVSAFFLICYLIIHYTHRRNFYMKLSRRPTEIEELLEKTDQSPIAKAFDQTVASQHALFVEQLVAAEQQQTNHLTFIDRWVHQMKTPLSVIELTARQVDEPDSSSIREETERIKSGLETVLYMARMRTIEQDFHIERVHVAQLIHEVNQENKRFYIRNNVYPHVDIENENVFVETDKKWLFFIIDQLVQNAVKYSVDKSNSIELTVSIDHGAASLSIRDHGVGIPLHDQKRIFNAFYTGDNGRQFRESTGMGLYLVREVLDYIGHTIELESIQDEGTVFLLRFSREQTILSH